MGEKQGKVEEKQKKTEGGGGTITVVLKMNLHCEGCALKVKRSLKRFDGVETVSVDIAGNKLTVVGKVDPVLLRERVEEKTRKKAELVSSVDSAAKRKDSGGDTKKPAAAVSDGGAAKEMKQPTEKKKAKAPQVSTIVPKIRLHCEGCINSIRRTIYKIKGVDDVSLDADNNLVTGKGTLDLKILPSILKDKLKHNIEVIPSKRDDGGVDKKDENTNKKENGDGKKKKDGKGGEKKKDCGEDKKKNEDGKIKVDGSDDNNVKKEVNETLHVVTVNKMEYYGSYGYPVEIAPSSYEYRVEMGSTSYGYESGLAQEPHQYMVNMTQVSLGYEVDLTHAPQMFSDENPNACSIM